MSAEFVRRRLVTRIGGNNKNDVINALCEFFKDFEANNGTVEEIEAPSGEDLPFRTNDGKRFAVYNWMPYMDMAETKKKGIKLQPLAFREAVDEEEGGGRGYDFGNLLNMDINILWFCIFAIWLCLVVAGILVTKAVFFTPQVIK